MVISTEKEYNRYSIAEGDFGFALDCIREARKHSLDNIFLFEVLAQMAIICCCRPFTPNEKGADAQAISRLSISDLARLLPEDVNIYEKYMTLRNKAIAHSEFSYHETHFHPETGGTRRTRFTLLRHEWNLNELEDLITKLIKECRFRRIDYSVSRSDERIKED
jgi:hypothetical protein